MQVSDAIVCAVQQSVACAQLNHTNCSTTVQIEGQSAEVDNRPAVYALAVCASMTHSK